MVTHITNLSGAPGHLLAMILSCCVLNVQGCSKPNSIAVMTCFCPTHQPLADWTCYWLVGDTGMSRGERSWSRAIAGRISSSGQTVCLTPLGSLWLHWWRMGNMREMFAALGEHNTYRTVVSLCSNIVASPNNCVLVRDMSIGDREHQMHPRHCTYWQVFASSLDRMSLSREDTHVHITMYHADTSTHCNICYPRIQYFNINCTDLLCIQLTVTCTLRIIQPLGQIYKGSTT